MNAPPRGSRRAALVALGLAALGGLALLLWAVADPPAGPPSIAGSAAGAPPEPAPSTQPTPPAEPSAAAAAPAADAPASPPDWPDVELVARVSELGSALARDVHLGLQRARAELDGCYAAATAEEEAAPAADSPEDAFGAAIVTLQLEGRPGELVVVGAPLQELGTSSPALVDCCEGVLRGFRIPAPRAEPGKRYRLQYQLVE